MLKYFWKFLKISSIFPNNFIRQNKIYKLQKPKNIHIKGINGQILKKFDFFDFIQNLIAKK